MGLAAKFTTLKMSMDVVTFGAPAIAYKARRRHVLRTSSMPASMCARAQTTEPSLRILGAKSQLPAVRMSL